jgi:poly(3-hydroxybutyrate) depolymerase
MTISFNFLVTKLHGNSVTSLGGSMKKLFVFLIGITSALSLASAAGTVISDSFYSDALGGTRYMRIYLPEGYDTSGIDYPVVYFFHGGGSNHMGYSYIYGHVDTLIANGHIDPVIVVKPDASVGPYYGSCYTNSALYGDFEDYLVYDLVSYIDTTYRVISSRNTRCVMGHSMGGSGALKIAFKHPDVYRAVVDHSGLVDHDVLLQYYVPLILAENGGGPPYTYNPNAGVFTGVAFTMSGAFSPDTTDPVVHSRPIQLIRRIGWILFSTVWVMLTAPSTTYGVRTTSRYWPRNCRRIPLRYILTAA